MRVLCQGPAGLTQMFSFTQPPTQGVKGCEKEVQCIQNGQGLVRKGTRSAVNPSVKRRVGGGVLKRK